jgi:predicted ATP-dependent endonuclease of OLD family
LFREIEVVKGDKMIIEKMKIKNFKRFKGEVEINYNSDFNVIIGNNESGKSSILQAIDLVLSGNKNKIENIGLDNLIQKL